VLEQTVTRTTYLPYSTLFRSRIAPHLPNWPVLTMVVPPRGPEVRFGAVGSHSDVFQSKIVIHRLNSYRITGNSDLTRLGKGCRQCSRRVLFGTIGRDT